MCNIYKTVFHFGSLLESCVLLVKNKGTHIQIKLLTNWIKLLIGRIEKNI